MNRGVWGHVRASLLRGLVLVLPLVITVWLLGLLFDVINTRVTPHIRGLFLWLGITELERWFARWGIPVVGLVLTATFVYLLGLFAGHLVGRRIVRGIESFILRIPLIKGVYGAARQLLDAFTSEGSRTFSRVVLLEYPRRGLWTVGFVTAEFAHRLPGSAEGRTSSVPVFLPTTPNPTSGWMLLVPSADLHDLDMSIEEGMKLIVSGGIVSPGDLGRRIRPRKAAGD